MWNKIINQRINAGVHVSMEELIALRAMIKYAAMPIKKNALEIFSGQHHAKVRGRGIEFDATREYQPGDDIRRMAWRVTARSLKPHIKIYHEEKERPVWLAVDLSPSLYFGTRTMFKSVRSIKQAAYLGWMYLQKRERIGAAIATTQKTFIFKPESLERGLLNILKSLVESSKTRPAFTDNNCLHHLLTTLQTQVRPDNLLFILSDFFQFDTRNQKLIVHLAQSAQLKLIFVYDPFEAISPPANRYLLTDGKEIAQFAMDSLQNREHYQQQFQQKLNSLTKFARKHNIPFQVIRTDHDEEVRVKT